MSRSSYKTLHCSRGASLRESQILATEAVYKDRILRKLKADKLASKSLVNVKVKIEVDCPGYRDKPYVTVTVYGERREKTYHLKVRDDGMSSEGINKGVLEAVRLHVEYLQHLIEESRTAGR